jgi:solute carrier family 32 (vesicular inhibitory amino acid transporter)
LALIPGYNQGLIKTTLFFIAINPLTKYALVLSPVNTALENSFGLQSNSTIILSRSLISLFALLVAIAVPQFHKVMGFIGSVLSFGIAVIFPTSCYLSLKWHDSTFLMKIAAIITLCIGIVCMAYGTVGVLLH